MNSFEITFVDEQNKSCGYICTNVRCITAIMACCGCTPSRWDGCRGQEVEFPAQKGLELAKSLIGIEHSETGCTWAFDSPKTTKQRETLIDETIDFFHKLLDLCTTYPETRLEVRY